MYTCCFRGLQLRQPLKLIYCRPTHTGLEVAQFFTLTTKLSAVNRSCSLYASRLSLQHGPASLYHELLTIKGFTTALGEGVLTKKCILPNLRLSSFYFDFDFD